MSSMSFSLLEHLTKGWFFPYKAKAWHYFEDKKSLCGKYTLSDWQEGGLLPCLNIFDKRCKSCLNLKKEEN